MNDVSYWKSQLDSLQAKPPKSTANYYNKDFVDRMNQAQANIDGLVAQKDKSWAATQQAQDDYETFRGSMTSYNDAYKNAEAEFGVSAAGADYEKSKKALAMAEMTLSALPSQINAQSNVVLTQSQREARYNVLSNQFNSQQSRLMKENETYKKAWQNARENQQAYAQAEIAAQQNKLENFNNAWVTSMNAYNDAEEKWRQARIEKQQIGSDYRVWQLNQANLELYEYINKLNTALSRYVTAMDTQNAIVSDKLDKMEQYIKQTSSKVDEASLDLLASGFRNGYMSGDTALSLAKSVGKN